MVKEPTNQTIDCDSNRGLALSLKKRPLQSFDNALLVLGHGRPTLCVLILDLVVEVMELLDK